MVKQFFFLVLVCTLAGCQKNTVQINTDEQAPSYKMSSDFASLSPEVRNIITNGGAGHFGCEVSNNKESINAGTFGESSVLGDYAYPYSLNQNIIKLYRSSLPCQPSIPYFIFSNLEREGEGKTSTYAATFHLVLNQSYFDSINVVDVDWELNGQNMFDNIQTFTINNLQIGGASNSITCKVFSTENNVTVYSQDMSFEFEILIDIGSGPVIEFLSGSSYACTNTGIFPIVAP